MATKTVAHLTLIALLITGAAAYTNHTVGGNAGWLFDATTNTTAIKYSDWAANQKFNLGDYLIFNTNTNQTVIQTYNKTTYRSCTTDDASDTDTFQYGGGNNQFGQALTVPVPLTIEGSNYFFSDADDGVQCEQGMAFEITVRHGNGLPPSLNQPPPPPYVEPPSSDDGSQSPPITVASNQPSGSGGIKGANVRWGAYGLACVILVISV